jgi:O-antigen ligase/tetratricopeptide (TPR) repeat protein
MTKHNIWTVSIIGLLFVLLCTPLIVATGLYFPYVTGKVFTFRIIVSILAILWLILVLKYPQFLPKKSSVLMASGAFVLWLGIANTTGVDPMNSFFSNFERMEGWFTHVYLFVYLVIISSVVQTEKIWNWILNVSVIVANYIALRATFDTESRTQVILGNSTYVAIYVLFNLFFAGLLLYRLFQKSLRDDPVRYARVLYYISSIILFIYVIFRTQTRGTVLALVFSFLGFLILTALSYWKNKTVRTVSIVLLGFGIIGSILFWANRDSAFIQNNPLLVRVATISATEGTGKARLVNWGIAFEGIKERPILGWGQENYSYVFAQKYDPRMYAQEPWFDRTHNMFLDWGVQGGIPAIVLYVGLFLTAVWTIYYSTSLARIEKNILISLLGAYVVHNMFVFDNYSSYLMFFTTLGFIVHHSQSKKYEIMWDEKIKQATGIVLIVCIVIVSWFTIVKPLQAGTQLIETLTQKDPAISLAIYKDIFEQNSFATVEAGIRLFSDASRYAQADDVQVFSTYKQIAESLSSDFKLTNDVRRLETYGIFLLQMKDIDQAIEVLEKARTLAPNRQNNLYTLGITYLNAGEFDKAKEVFKHAYEVLPENDKARTYYGAILLATGDVKGKELIQGYNYKDSFFISMFAQSKQYKEIIKIREQIKKDEPNNYQNQVSLAVAYYLDKQPAKAIALIREVQKVVPEFKGQGDYLIKEIQAGRSIAK